MCAWVGCVASSPRPGPPSSTRRSAAARRQKGPDLWSAACRRLLGRSGRSVGGWLVRCWPVPLLRCRCLRGGCVGPVSSRRAPSLRCSGEAWRTLHWSSQPRTWGLFWEIQVSTRDNLTKPIKFGLAPERAGERAEGPCNQRIAATSGPRVKAAVGKTSPEGWRQAGQTCKDLTCRVEAKFDLPQKEEANRSARLRR